MKANVSSSNKRKKKQATKKEKTQRTNTEIDRLVHTLRKLKNENKSDGEIRTLLGLELRWYQKLMKKIHDEDAEVWYGITRESLESEMLALKSSLEHTYIISKTLSEDTKYRWRIEALQEKDSARISIVQLLVEGPKYAKVAPPLESNHIYEENDTEWRERGKKLFGKDDKI